LSDKKVPNCRIITSSGKLLIKLRLPSPLRLRLRLPSKRTYILLSVRKRRFFHLVAPMMSVRYGMESSSGAWPFRCFHPAILICHHNSVNIVVTHEQLTHLSRSKTSRCDRLTVTNNCLLPSVRYDYSSLGLLLLIQEEEKKST